MGRPKRIQFAGACSLVMFRGNNRQDLFLSNQDRRQFLSLLKFCKERFDLKIYAYSLMANHVDLLIETPQANLSVVMQALNARYTKYFNAAHNTVGHVLQDRYKSWVVDKETHLAAMTRYVHLACVRDALKDKPWRYPWSSCAAYVQSERKEPLVDSAAVLRKFGHVRLKQSVRYLQYIKNQMGTASDEILPIVGGVAIGGEAFLAKVLAHSDAPPAARPVPIEAARRILAEVCSRHGTSEEEVLGRVQWREVSAARQEAVHRIWKEARMRVLDLARLFSRTPSSVSQMIRGREKDLKVK